MKIGIVTTYDEINFGAYLQAYSLQKYIESLGYDSEFINYKSFEYKKAEIFATYKTKDFSYLLEIIKKSIKFYKALSCLDISKKYRSIRDINNAKYDVIIFGSDEIWNLSNCLGGIIDTYYFGACMNSKKISYAPSFGSTSTLENSPDNIKRALLDFRHISLRDKNSFDIINSIFPKEPAIVLDPTFLIDHPAKESNISSKYIFYYCASDNPELDMEVERLSEKLGIEVIAFGYKHKKFKSIVNIGPFEWLGYLKSAEYVVTNMFHGTIFSIKYKKKFIVGMTEYRENKLGYLLELLALRDRVYKTNELENVLFQDIDYSKTFEIISEMTNKSKDYLKKALKCS
ncbi:hypothetical protein DSLASN_21160 [Desulfoluna limicola]|uniref:Polysaccharide pyruvyl transferase domain-containing protein n=1 Tax=Desulfoluna limicola TaxID=2810562 RepID=A0ABN6F1U0_9BACT|nr:polysaccharide pyruvyl transferase family protein [Desulfoluna limicola]BCS96484.1 hypothetical protein DSLASN_21160 [Desulfoluna limicola]